ncbi:MAG: spore germination protein [Firmicutes bacterium]|nr:spore germination protein [Bacillota bacterium]
MKNVIHVKPQQMINAFLVFFVVHTTQIGVGIHGFQRIIYQESKQDAWFSVLVIGIVSHVIVIVMIKTLEMYDSHDLYGINREVFGTWIGNFINVIYFFYCSVAFFSVLINYIEVIQTWIFPLLSTWFISATLLLLVIYTFLGGLRVIVGVSFFSFMLAFWLIFVLVFPLQYSDPQSLFPILESKFIDILKGAKAMTFTIIGFEILYIIFPFVKDKKNIRKPVHYGLLVTTLMYLAVILVSLTYFSGEQLSKTIWATLSLFSIVQFPFLERFEFLAVCFWMLIILPNLCLYVWAAHRGLTGMINISAKKFIWLFSCIVLLLTFFIKSRIQINSINNIFGQVAFYIVFIYPLFLYVLALVKKKLTS